MTALGGRDVERTFSRDRQDLTGLLRLNTHEATGQDFRDLSDIWRFRPRITLFKHDANLKHAIGLSSVHSQVRKRARAIAASSGLWKPPCGEVAVGLVKKIRRIAAVVCAAGGCDVLSVRLVSRVEFSEAASHLSGEQSLLQFLLQDRLVAASTDEKTSQVVEVLGRDRWKKIEILDWKRSSARDGVTRRKLHGLRIFPVIHSPNASIRLAGENLNEVILRDIFHDPQVQLLAKRMLAEDELARRCLQRRQISKPRN